MRNRIVRIKCGLVTMVMTACICFICVISNAALAYADTPEQPERNGLTCYVGTDNRYPLCYRDEKGELCGDLIELTKLLEQELGTEIILVHEAENDEIYEQLSDGKLDIALGVPDTGAADKDITRSEALFCEKLTGIILSTSRNESEDRIGGYYWGIVSGLESLTKGTAYESHAVEMMNEKELIKALKDADVYGILLDKSRVDYMLLGEKKGLAGIGRGLKVYQGPMPEYELFGFIGAGVNDALRQSILTAVNSYAEKNYKNSSAQGDEQYAEYANLAAKIQQSDSRTALICAALCAALVLMTVMLCMLTKKHKEVKKQAIVESRLLQQDMGDRAIFRTDTGTKTISNTAGFVCLGFVKGEIDCKVQLEELTRATGFDYMAHYEKIASAGDGDFECRYILYRNGKKQYITEIGNVSGKMITSIITNVSNNK